MALQADGIITRLYNNALAAVVREVQVPIVAVHNRGELPIPNVCDDNNRIAAIAAEHLLGQGFQQFAFFGAIGRRFSEERFRSFERALAAKGYACEHFLVSQIEQENPDWYAHNKALVGWLSGLPRPIAIFAANDVLGQQLLLNAPRAGVRVPDDAAVLGVDNDELVCCLTSPPLSSIDTNGERIGYQAAALLDRMLQGKPIAERNLIVEPGELIVRQSSDVLAVDDSNIADAVRFIRENTAACLDVADVLREVPVTRRTLERGFRKLLGRSIHDEIAESRIRRARQLLAETGMPIPRIAELCGFSDQTRMSKVFKHHTGYPPAAYRRQFRRPR